MIQRLDHSKRRLCDLLQTVIIGAGEYVEELTTLVSGDPLMECVGILDPDPALKGQELCGLPVLGWLGCLPKEAEAAVVGTPRGARAFDRESVYHLLMQRGLLLPAVAAPDVECAGAELGPGCLVLPGVRIAAGVRVGDNSLIGAGAELQPGAAVGSHSVVRSGRIIRSAADAKHKFVDRSLEAIVVAETETLGKVIHQINWSNLEIILVVDGNGALLGTVTDGDIRRGILSGISLDDPVSLIMNFSPVSVGSDMPREEMLQLMRRYSIRHLPVLDGARRPVRLERLEQLIDTYTGQAVVMAGGLGTRLKPYTNHTPKPLVAVAGRPILDHTLSGLRNSGIENVVISLNHMGDQIRRHVASGNRHDMNIDYVDETKRLGTAGALSLLEPRPDKPFVVLNGDLMTNLNFSRVLEFQAEEDYDMVICVRQHAIQIPYGVIEMVDGKFEGMREKPNVESFINAGIYVLKPDCIDLVPQSVYFDMPSLIETIRGQGGSIGIFPILEYWRDIGRPEDLESADLEHEDRMFSLRAASTRIPMENIA